jgi:hypothetical protein
MQQANASGIDYEDKALSDLNARSGALRGAAEAGDITGGGFPGIRGFETGLGAFAKGPVIKKKKPVAKTTKVTKVTKPELEGGTGSGAGDLGTAEGDMSGTGAEGDPHAF